MEVWKCYPTLETLRGATEEIRRPDESFHFRHARPENLGCPSEDVQNTVGKTGLKVRNSDSAGYSSN